MISVQEKLDIFRQELAQQVQEARENEIGRAKKESEEQLRRTDEYVENQEQEIERRYQLLKERNIGRLLALARTSGNEDILKTQKEIRENFDQTVKEALGELRESKLYREYLKVNIKRLSSIFMGRDTIILYVLKDERELLEKITTEELKNFRVIYRDLPPGQIGGFFARDLDERINYDFSLLNLADDHTQLINSSLEKAIDNAQ